MASHTLNDEEYQALITGRREAEERAARLEDEIERIKLEDPAHRIAPLNDLARSMLTVVRFAVANLNPENTRGWPTGALLRVSRLMSTLADYRTDDGDLATELASFARDCDAYALHREKMRAEKLAADAAAPKGDLDRPPETAAT